MTQHHASGIRLRRLLGLLAAAVAALFVYVPAAAAATFTVTNTADSGAGSLRQAITDSNASGPGNTIAFAIPGPGPHVIAPASALPAIAQDNTTIDACTQPGSDCSGLPLSLRVRLEGQGFSLFNFGITIRGFSFTGAGAAVTFNRVARSGRFVFQKDVTIEHNYVGLAPDGAAAGKPQSFQTGSSQRNSVDPAERLRIIGNVIGSIGGPGVNLSGGGFGPTIPISGVRIAGNIIGLDPTGTQPRPNTGDGIIVDTSSAMQITGNLVAANGGVGIHHRGRAQAVRGTDPAVDPGLLIRGNVVEDNAAGGIVLEPDPPAFGPTSADPYGGPVNVLGNTVRGNGVAGVRVTAAAETLRPNLRIGGTGAGEPNTIAGNGGPGVAIGAGASDTSVAVTVRGNSIYANAGPGIDLASDGPTANAPAGTVRTGPNLLVNSPPIGSIGHGSVIVNGTYAGAPNATYTLDFYKSATADGPQTWIGSTSVTTDAAGVATYSAAFEPGVPQGTLIHATATDAEGNTSEFGVAAQAPPPPPPPAHELSISETVTPRRVTVGDTVEYTLRVHNAGPDAAADVRVTDTLPRLLDARRATSTHGSCSLDGNAVSCSLARLPAGHVATVTLRAVAIEAGRATDAARVLPPAGGVDDTSNNASRATVTIVKPLLRVAKTATERRVRAGEIVTYAIRVTNPSKRAVRGVRTCDHLPAGLVALDASAKVKVSKGSYCWTAKRIRAGHSKRYDLVVRALPGAAGRIVNRATASSRGVRRAARAARAVRVLPRQATGGGVTG